MFRAATHHFGDRLVYRLVDGIVGGGACTNSAKEYSDNEATAERNDQTGRQSIKVQLAFDIVL